MRNQSFVQLLAQMKFGVGSNDGKDQSFVEGSVHEDPTIEKDDSEDSDPHNTNDSYYTDQDNFNIDSVADVYENVLTPQNLGCDRPEANIHLCLRSLNL